MQEVQDSDKLDVGFVEGDKEDGEDLRNGEIEDLLLLIVYCIVPSS